MAENNPETPAQSPDKFDRLSSAVAMKADRLKHIVLAVVIIGIVAIAVFSYVRRSGRERANAAQNQVFQNIMNLQRNADSMDPVAIFGAQAKEFAGLPAGIQAQLYEFAFAFADDKFDVAERAARDFIRANPKNVMTPRVKFALGQTQMQLGKIGDAIASFREQVAANDPAIFPEAKLALAQALECDAEQVKDNPEEYRRRLEAASMEYNDIISRSRIVGGQRGFWPQAVVLPADFALVRIKDRLAGHVLAEPVAVTPPITPEEREAVMGIAPPAAGTSGTAGNEADASGPAAAIAAAASAGDAALLEAATAARDRLDAIAVAAGQESAAARAAVTASVKAGFDSVIDAGDAARRALSAVAAQASGRIAEITDPAEAERAIAAAGESIDESVKAGIESIVSVEESAKTALEMVVTKAESVNVSKDVVDLHGQTGLATLSETANAALAKIEEAAAKASEGLESGAEAVGEAAKAGYDAIVRVADESKSALQRTAREAAAKIDELAGDITSSDFSSAISEHVSAVRADFDSALKGASDAIAKAVEAAVEAVEKAGESARSASSEGDKKE